MKILFIFAVFALRHASLGAPVTGPSLDFEKISVDELHQALEDVRGGASRSALVNGALLSRRLDLIQQCFAYSLTGARLPEKLDIILDDVFRDEVVLMLIKSDARSFWPTEKMTGSFIWHYKMIEPLIPTFKRHLPNAKPLLDILMTKELRLKTAAELEAAMTGQKPPADPTQSGPPPTSSVTTTPTPPSSSENAAAENTIAATEKESSQSRLWWVLLVVVLAVAAGVLLKRRK